MSVLGGVRRWSSMVVAVAVVAGVLAAPAGAQEAGEESPPPELPERASGEEAIEVLGDDLPEVAAEHDMTASELEESFLDDETLFVDETQRLFFVDPAATDQQVEPTRAAAPFDLGQTFQLHSDADAERTIYLDFDGETIAGTAWNASMPGGGTITAEPFSLDADPAFSTAELEMIQSIWARVSEDFAPFAVDVTTEVDEAAIARTDSGDTEFGTRVLFAGDGTDAYQYVCPSGCGGFAYLDVFDFVGGSHDYYQPAFVFQDGLANSAKQLAEAATHEAGHNLGLHHDGLTSSPGGYYYGHGDWAPIMGVGYYEPVVQWSQGEYTNASSAPQDPADDFAVIAANGAPPVGDDHAATLDAAATPLPTGASTASESGTVGTAADVDVFRFDTPGGLVKLDAAPAASSPNLDIEMTLLDSSGTPVVTANPTVATETQDVATGMDASIQETLTAGTYYVRIDGVGTGNPTTGYSDYGSVGRYTLDAVYGVCGTDDDLDDDDSSTAAYLVPGQSTSGRRCADDDDWIRVPGLSGVGLTATLTVLDADLTVDVMDSAGTSVLSTTTASTSTPGTTTVTIPANADHFVRVTGSTESRYTLATAAGPPVCGGVDDQYEGSAPNYDNFPATATPMSIPSSRDGVACGADANQGDWISLALTAGRTLTAVMDYESTIGMSLQLHGPSPSTSNVAIGSSTTDKITLTYTPQVSGTYWLWARKSLNSGASQYHLETSQAALAAPTVTSVAPTTAQPGDQVTITGTGYYAVSSVTFAGPSGPLAATHTVNDPTSITATVPDGAIDGPVMVTNSAGSDQTTFDVDSTTQIIGFALDDLGDPVSDADCVSLRTYGQYEILDTATPDAGTGEFRFVDLDEDTYTVSFDCDGHTVEYWLDGEDLEHATPVGVPAGETVVLAPDAVLERLGSVTGTITSDGTTPVQGVCVVATPADDPFFTYAGSPATSGPDGSFSIGDLDPGQYQVVANHPSCGALKAGFGVAYLGGGASRSGADVVDLAPAEAEDADITLPAASTITGSVTGPTALSGTCVQIYAGTDTYAYRTVYLDGTSNYSAAGLGTGTHHVRFCGGSGAASEWFDDVTTRAAATALALTPGSSHTADAALVEGGTISGTVTAPVEIELICMTAYDVDGSDVGFTYSYNGNYQITGLAPGSYRVGFEDCGTTGLQPEFFDDAADLASATPVAVTSGGTTNVDAAMDLGPGSAPVISGILTDPLGHQARDVCVSARNATTGETTYAETDSAGSYDLTGLDDGDHVIRFVCDANSPYRSEYFDDAATYATATPITVTGGIAVGGGVADAQLAWSTTRSVLVGTVTDEVSGLPIPGACLNVFGETPSDFSYGWAADDGTYAIATPAGSSAVTVQFGCSGSDDYVREYFDDVHTQLDATPIPVPAIGSPATVDAALTPTSQAGRITGTVTGEPYDFDCLDVLDPVSGAIIDEGYASLDETGAGTFTTSYLAAGSYVVRLGGCYGHAITYFDGVDTFAEATPVAVVAGVDTTGVDMSFVSNTGSIVGTLTGPGSLEGVCVAAINPLSDSVVGQTTTDSSGSFEISDLTPGTYHVGYACGDESADDGYMIEFFDGSANGSFDYSDAAFVEVNVDSATDASSELDASASLVGTLTSSADGISPASGACVQGYAFTDSGPFWNYPSDIADANGQFALAARVEGDWHVTLGGCRPDGWDTLEVPDVTVVAGDTVDLSAELDPAPTGGISGTITDERGASLDFMCVSAYGESAYDNTFANTDEFGNYNLYELSDDTYSVSVYPCDQSNLLEQTLTVDVVGGAVTDQDVMLLDGATIEGTVTASTGGPVDGVCVSAEPIDGDGTYSYGYTESDGTYQLTRLDSDDYIVRFSGCDADGTSWIPTTDPNVPVLRPETVSNVDATLDPGSTITGTVDDADGFPIYGLCVDLGDGALVSRTTFTGSLGDYVFDDLPADTYTVAAGDCSFNELYVEESAEVVVGAAAGAVKNFELALRGKITGTITGSDGACVTAWNATSGDYVNSVCNSGGYYELFVPTESVKVEFTSSSPTFETLWYGGSDFESAAAVAVPAGGEVGDIDASFTGGNTPPTASFVFPTASPLKGVIDIQVEATDAETNVDYVDFYIDSDYIGTASETDGDGYWSLRWNSAAYGDGQLHTFEAIAYDTEGVDSTPAVIEPLILDAANGDFDGDGVTDLAVYRPSNGGWYMWDLTTNSSIAGRAWGTVTGDIPVPGDYNGDGVTDLAVYRPSNGGWYMWDLTTNSSIAGRAWGTVTGDIPVPGDYNGDGVTDLAVYRPSNGGWYMWDLTTNSSIAGRAWGTVTGDIPVPGDYNGDGVTDLAVYRPSNGGWYMWDLTTNSSIAGRAWGTVTGDIPVPGDYNGDGVTDLAVYRPSNGGWYMWDLTTNSSIAGRAWGTVTGDIPVPGDYNGDGVTDLAVYRPSNGGWYMWDLTTNSSIAGRAWGTVTGDIPVPTS